jgi:hypothetical protein
MIGIASMTPTLIFMWLKDIPPEEADFTRRWIEWVRANRDDLLQIRPLFTRDIVWLRARGGSPQRGGAGHQRQPDPARWTIRQCGRRHAFDRQWRPTEHQIDRRRRGRALLRPVRRYVATRTDRRLFIAAPGNTRIVGVKLDYHTTDRTPLGDVPDLAQE